MLLLEQPFIRFICVPLCSSMVHLDPFESSEQQSMYSIVTIPYPDFHSSLRNIVKTSARPLAIFCPQWQRRCLPLIEVHLRESTLVVEVCVYRRDRACRWLFLFLQGSLSDRARKWVWVYFLTENTFMITVRCFWTASSRNNGSE